MVVQGDRQFLVNEFRRSHCAVGQLNVKPGMPDTVSSRLDHPGHLLDLMFLPGYPGRRAKWQPIQSLILIFICPRQGPDTYFYCSIGSNYLASIYSTGEKSSQVKTHPGAGSGLDSRLPSRHWRLRLWPGLSAKVPPFPFYPFGFQSNPFYCFSSRFVLPAIGATRSGAWTRVGSYEQVTLVLTHSPLEIRSTAASTRLASAISQLLCRIAFIHWITRFEGYGLALQPLGKSTAGRLSGLPLIYRNRLLSPLAHFSEPPQHSLLKEKEGPERPVYVLVAFFVHYCLWCIP